ncbi:MAG: MtrB/PioB family outer membrane beta-barrel protein, partial [Myxococcota bacterium]
MQRSSNRRTGRVGARKPALPVILACLAWIGSAAGAQEEGFEIEEDGYADEQRRRELTTFGSWIELGALYNGSNDKLFGNYNGLLDEQGYFLGNLDILRRDLFGRGDDHYARLRGLNLGLDSRYVGAEAGRQGHYDLFFEFDELPVFRSETAQTFFGGGDQHLTLPSPWTPGANGTQMTQLDANLTTLDIDWKRKRYSGGASLALPANLGFDVRYDYESKEGQRLSGSAMGLTGGNPRAVVIPAPIDYVTQQVEAALNYAGESLQAKV